MSIRIALLLLLQSLTRHLVRALHPYSARPQRRAPELAFELGIAQAACSSAATALLSESEAAAREVLGARLAGTARTGQRWVTHVDARSVVLSLVGSRATSAAARRPCLAREDSERRSATGPATPPTTLLSVVYCPHAHELAVAALDRGTSVIRRGAPEEAPVLGDAAPNAMVISTPAIWCAETNDLCVHLQQTGTGMPLQLAPRDAGRGGAGHCEGLLDVLLGRADLHVAPPSASACSSIRWSPLLLYKQVWLYR